MKSWAGRLAFGIGLAVTADQPGDRNFNAAPFVKRTLQIYVPPSPP